MIIRKRNKEKNKRIRVDYLNADIQQRIEMENLRESKHNVFIDACNILSRNMLKKNENADWRIFIGNDRKVLGDFACYIHCILGIKAR